MSVVLVQAQLINNMIMRDKLVFQLCGVLVISIVWIAAGGFSRIAVELESRSVFLNSRAGSPRSFDFITAGITNGMFENQVDILFKDRASRIIRRLPSEQSMSNGFQNIYVWNHGSPWKPLWGRHGIRLYEEWFFVSFDQNSQARQVIRYLANAGDPFISRDVVAELGNRSLHKVSDKMKGPRGPQRGPQKGSGPFSHARR